MTSYGLVVPRPARAARTVLVIDDDEACCYAMANLIRHAGYDVVDACAFTPALAALENAERPVELLLTDVKMTPHGFALARMAQRRRPGIKVLYLTGFPELADVETPLPGSRILTKPIDPDALIATIDACFCDAE
ncbi:MAG TPA: response regulator [Stellaceae bacterium]